VLVIVPTYNEIDSLERVVAAVRAAAPSVDVLVVDDASPDGTGALADRLASDDDRVGRANSGTTSWSRWTPTGRIRPPPCRPCSTGWSPAATVWGS
jgi:glycosyltransferase involved in cell wall biosynthesis